MYMLAATNISEKTQLAKFAKYNSTPKFVDLQYLYIYFSNNRAVSLERLLFNQGHVHSLKMTHEENLL